MGHMQTSLRRFDTKNAANRGSRLWAGAWRAVDRRKFLWLGRGGPYLTRPKTV